MATLWKSSHCEKQPISKYDKKLNTFYKKNNSEQMIFKQQLLYKIDFQNQISNNEIHHL